MIIDYGISFRFPGTLLDGTLAEWKAMIDTKVLGLSVCTREAVRSMKAKGINDGHIINIGSIFGQYVPKGRPSSHMNATSQIAMKALTEGTRNELCQVGKNFRVTELSPGKGLWFFNFLWKCKNQMDSKKI